MSAHKHTPGPWNVGATDAETAEIDVVSEGRPYICLVLPGAVDGRTEANARLIAAAPDSHEANVMFVKAMDRFCGIKPDWDDDCIYDELPSSELALAYFAARAAIAKATGEPA
ncbi:hypothetical protein [Stenotrophomonas acidaminiphila]|uniref:hypothetical protein n=1 Tax=Stenotrophomonas acidaminiphila TaxID=128780 RepID=UPI0028A915A3|nr:hypothetical protein [Stenotrophomonas acidaminiphila]